MSFDYNRRAPDYDRYRSPGGPHVSILTDLAKRADAKSVLELGPGTGNSAASFLEQMPCRLIGLERSSGMLSHGRQKGLGIYWVNGDACRQPFANDSFDFVFSVLAFHHLEDFASCIRESFRVLRTGCLGIVTAPEKFIENHFLNTYFPRFRSIDAARFQPERELAACMDEAGFQGANITYCKRAPVPVDAKFVEKVAGKFLSTLALIPDNEFAQGLERLKRDVEVRGNLSKPFVWEAAVVSGWKVA